MALGYGLNVGDTLAFNVLGRVVEARIASLRREIDWSSGRLDFVFILSPGVIEGAPHTWIAAVDLPAADGPAFVDRLAEQLPNVTPIEVRQVAAQVEDVLAKIALAVRTVAAITLVSGALVLAGAVGAARRRHRYQAVMLKVLGARRRDVVRMFLLEYAVLGLAAAIVGRVDRQHRGAWRRGLVLRHGILPGAGDDRLCRGARPAPDAGRGRRRGVARARPFRRGRAAKSLTRYILPRCTCCARSRARIGPWSISRSSVSPRLSSPG